MKAKLRPLTLIALIATLGFMLASVSCTSAQLASAQKTLTKINDGYQKKTGITVLQTTGLAWNWWLDYKEARALNVLPPPDMSGKTALDLRP